jgi:hypothetical protein
MEIRNRNLFEIVDSETAMITSIGSVYKQVAA